MIEKQEWSSRDAIKEKDKILEEIHRGQIRTFDIYEQEQIMPYKIIEEKKNRSFEILSIKLSIKQKRTNQSI